MTACHLCRSKTEEQVRRRAYWPCWRQLVASKLKKCVECCVKCHRGSAPKQTPLDPFGAGAPFEVIALDITGKHPRNSRENEYILTVTDLISKWSEAYPLRNHTAQTVARVLVDQYFQGTVPAVDVSATWVSNFSRTTSKKSAGSWRSRRSERQPTSRRRMVALKDSTER